MTTIIASPTTCPLPPTALGSLQPSQTPIAIEYTIGYSKQTNNDMQMSVKLANFASSIILEQAWRGKLVCMH